MAQEPVGRSVGDSVGDSPGDSVGELAELYLGNLLYALELAAMSLERDGKAEHAAFYRGIARKMAQARGRTTGAEGQG
jgi:hypothetical protein